MKELYPGIHKSMHTTVAIQSPIFKNAEDPFPRLKCIRSTDPASGVAGRRRRERSGRNTIPSPTPFLSDGHCFFFFFLFGGERGVMGNISYDGTERNNTLMVRPGNKSSSCATARSPLQGSADLNVETTHPRIRTRCLLKAVTTICRQI